jgi:hypothetical protein
MKALMAATVLIAMGASTALAIPPANDDFDNATEILDLPFSEVVDTTEATTAGDDPDCFGQGPTVWYSFTPLVDTEIQADTFGSDYDTTLSVYTGTRGALDQLVCNDDAGFSTQSRVRFDAFAGETYFFMVGAFASGPGGTLDFFVDVAPPAPPPLEIDLSIDRTGRFLPTGEAEISGILTCSQSAFADLFGTLRQTVGRFIIQGFFSTFFECDGETAWSATVTSDTGLFRGGQAKVDAFAFAFVPDTDEFAEDEELATVRLRGGRR